MSVLVVSFPAMHEKVEIHTVRVTPSSFFGCSSQTAIPYAVLVSCIWCQRGVATDAGTCTQLWSPVSAIGGVVTTAPFKAQVHVLSLPGRFHISTNVLILYSAQGFINFAK